MEEVKSLDLGGGVIPKTVMLGVYENTIKLREALIVGGIHLDRFTSFALSLSSFAVVRQNITIGTVRCFVANLGFARGAFFKEIYQCAVSGSGIKFYPPEFTMLLRLLYLGQPVGERLWVITDAVQSVSDKGRFSIDHDRHDGLCVRGHIGPDQIWLDPHEEIVIPVVQRHESR